jgi:hypothetical protein
VRVRLTEDVLIEPFGSEVVVFDHKSSEIARFSGEHASLLLRVQAEGTVETESSFALHELLNSGVLVGAGVFSRRKALTLGAGAVGAGVVSLSMPAMAFAQSQVEPEVEEDVEPNPPFGFRFDFPFIDFSSGGDFWTLELVFEGIEGFDAAQEFAEKIELSVGGQTFSTGNRTNTYQDQDTQFTIKGADSLQGESLWVLFRLDEQPPTGAATIRWEGGGKVSETYGFSIPVDN